MLLNSLFGRADDFRTLLPRMSVIAFAREHLISAALGCDLNLVEFSIQNRILGIVAKAILVMQLVGDLFQRFLEPVDAMDFEHAAAGGFGHLLQHVLPVIVLFIGMDDIAAVEARAFPRRIVNLQHVGDHVVLQQDFESFFET